MKYMQNPQFQVTFPVETFTCRKLIDAQINLIENDYWTAKLTFDNEPDLFPHIINAGTPVIVEVKDASEITWTKIFSGTCLIPDYTTSSPKNLTVQCVGEGYALNMMNALEEYGTQSRNPLLDTLTEILTDTNAGLISKWVNHYQGSTTASGYNINTTKIETITDVITYTSSQDKPIDKYLNDLIDIVTALKLGGAGPQWIVDNDKYLRVKIIGSEQSGWTKYVGGYKEVSTITKGIDYVGGDFQPIGKQANVVKYHGTWRRPSDGDAWTENTPTLWGCYSENTIAATGDYNIVDAYGINCTKDAGAVNSLIFWTPKEFETVGANWNFSYFNHENIPSINFYLLRNGAIGLNSPSNNDNKIRLFLVKTPLADPEHSVGEPTDAYYTDLTVSSADENEHFSIPLTDSAWKKYGTIDWTEINGIEFWTYTGTGVCVSIDGLYFGGATVYRTARQEFPDEIVAGRGSLGATTNPIRMKVITDSLDKDDSLDATDDTGLMAQFAYAELLRLCKTVINGKLTTLMVPIALPGQYLYIDGKDWRATRLTHTISATEGMHTNWEVTDDLTNSHPRLRFEDVNKIYESIRPEWQDRQSSSIKAGNIDIRVTPLEKAYNIT
jgi:hypothetical protein